MKAQVIGAAVVVTALFVAAGVSAAVTDKDCGRPACAAVETTR